MELDDDMFLVIVGDQDSPDVEPCQEVTRKQEKEDTPSLVADEQASDHKPSDFTELLIAINQEKDHTTPSLVADEQASDHKPSDFTELLNAIKQQPEDYEVEFLDENYDFFLDAPETVDDTYNPKKHQYQGSKKSTKKVKNKTCYTHYSNPHLRVMRQAVRSDDNTSNTKNVRNLTQKPKSYVEDMVKQNPELEDDNEALVDALVEVMRRVRPPPLPQDYFVMNDINFECTECGHFSETIPAASRHYTVKHGPRYLVCLACGCDFRSTTNLYKHERRCRARYSDLVVAARACRARGHKYKDRVAIKKEPKTYPCTLCSAVFRSPGGLQAHVNCHLGRRPHLCSVCSRAYSSRPALCRHLKKHSDRQFICDHCQRSFKVKSALVAHMDTHKPERKFPCSECAQRFAQRAALELHVRRVHEHLPPPCACALCPARYPRMTLLKNHMLRKHGLHLMTKKMFYKQLPTLTETQLQEAAVIANADLDFVYVDSEHETSQPTYSSRGEMLR